MAATARWGWRLLDGTCVVLALAAVVYAVVLSTALSHAKPEGSAIVAETGQVVAALTNTQTTMERLRGDVAKIPIYPLGRETSNIGSAADTTTVYIRTASNDSHVLRDEVLRKVAPHYCECVDVAGHARSVRRPRWRQCHRCTRWCIAKSWSRLPFMGAAMSVSIVFRARIHRVQELRGEWGGCSAAVAAMSDSR